MIAWLSQCCQRNT